MLLLLFCYYKHETDLKNTQGIWVFVNLTLVMLIEIVRLPYMLNCLSLLGYVSIEG